MIELLPLSTIHAVDAFMLSNLPGQLIVVLLFLGSIVVWTIMMTKGRELSKAQRSSRTFVRSYRLEQHPAALFDKQRKFADSPLHSMYDQGCGVLSAELRLGGSPGVTRLPAGHLDVIQIQAVRTAVEREAAEQALRLEESMGWLASATTSAPFLGLLGTVLGVMDAFGSMGVSGSALLADVAPGISAALLTTVVGLFVAIPSSLGYNHLGRKIRALCVNMENFTEEFVSDIERHYARPHQPATPPTGSMDASALSE